MPKKIFTSDYKFYIGASENDMLDSNNINYSGIIVTKEHCAIK